MARKNLLKGLMEDASKDGQKSPEPVDQQTRKTESNTPKPSRRPVKGAIGAVSQSIEALKARSLLDIDPFLIDAGGLQDRLENDVAEDQSLLNSIREYGQQVPILVRPHPETEGRYQIVYGRRRVLALRDLGQPVKAMVRDLDDARLVMAQGQENTARRGLSFIEKANFAAQMRDHGYKRKAIIDALSIDKTLVSRMLLIVDRIGYELVTRIGAAPNIGRDRWGVLANEIEQRAADPQVIIGMLSLNDDGANSDARFEKALEFIAGQPVTSAAAADREAPLPVKGRQSRRKIHNSATGATIAAVMQNPEKVVMTIDRAESGGFEDWLVDNLDSIHRDWLESVSQDDAKDQTGE